MIALNGLSFVCISLGKRMLMAVTWVMIFWLSKENKKLDRIAAENAAQLSSVAKPTSGDVAEITATGHAPERFRYMI